MPTETAQAGATIATTIIGIIPVVIGGLLTAGGGFVGAYVQHKLGKASAKENLKREKLELLVQMAHQATHWLDSYKNEKLFDGEKLIIQNPLNQFEMLCDLYFPELDEQKRRVSLSCAKYGQWVIKGVKERLQGRGLTDEYINEFEPVYEELLKSISAMSAKAREIMNELNRS